MNSNTFERLQLNEVKELIKIHCVSSLSCNLSNVLLFIIFSPLFISYRLLNHPIIYFDNSYFANNLINKELL
ncbi:hypothetical protein, partial [Clostridioides difficile]|uniref:hypothetical protein n=1 Tax=Clostridioides difficile TaxID=1496 RepID=UPI0018DD1F63